MLPNAVPLVEVWRGPILESTHLGHAVICGPDGEIVEAWGDPQTVILPRSSCKMIQALPLVESGVKLPPRRLALACASHQGAAVHTTEVRAWLTEIGKGEADLCCGAHPPQDVAMHHQLIRQEVAPTRLHNNCSGKHAGFLELARHMGAGPDYVDPAHPVQRAVRDTFEEVTGETSPGHGIDGCSAPNFATTLHGLARGMARFAVAGRQGGVRAQAMERLVEAMMAHPVLVAGEGRACTELMRAADGHAAIKTGAEGVFIAILPGRGLGLALKIADGATRASECAVAALLVRLGLLKAGDPLVRKRLEAPVRDWRGVEVGRICPVPGLASAAPAG
jgi:L-asparaginase II